MPDYDFLIAGGGLAGACAAVYLRDHGSVLVMEKDAPAAGASGVAVGLVNPILGRRAKAVWRMSEALAALDESLALAGAGDAFERRPTLRPAGDDEQVERFRRTAREHPEHATWLAESPFDWLHAPKGLLRIETGGMVDVEGFVRRALSRVDVHTAAPVEAWREYDDGVEVDGITARYLILALGRSYTAFPELMRLRLHQVKGQVVRVRRPARLPADAPHVAGSGYLAAEVNASAQVRRCGSTYEHHSADVPRRDTYEHASADVLTCGSTYEHAFADLRPSRRATEIILKKAAGMVPSIRRSEVVEVRTGVRVTVPGLRLPMVGPLPGRRRVWVFSGLGAKGLLTAPLVAKELARYLENPQKVPVETRVRLVKGLG